MVTLPLNDSLCVVCMCLLLHTDYIHVRFNMMSLSHTHTRTDAQAHARTHTHTHTLNSKFGLLYTSLFSVISNSNYCICVSDSNYSCPIKGEPLMGQLLVVRNCFMYSSLRNEKKWCQKDANVQGAKSGLSTFGDRLPAGLRSLIQESTKLSPVLHLKHWIWVLVQKGSNAKQESHC